MTKLHPLHSEEMRNRSIANCGSFDSSRQIGQSTAIALRLLAEVIDNPGIPVEVVDHGWIDRGLVKPPTSSMNRDLTKRAVEMALRLGLRHIRHNTGTSIIFGDKLT